MNSYFGYKIFQSVAIPEFKEAHRQERKWARRLTHQRYRRFDVRLERTVIVVGDSVHMHPNTYAILNLQMANNSNIGVAS